ncbi:hypothetical protein [Moraxella nonliquefaciens]|nr:hypothetical protein [Moraxella nonliquefaciens]
MTISTNLHEKWLNPIFHANTKGRHTPISTIRHQQTAKRVLLNTLF